jgi:hypothetical protein
MDQPHSSHSHISHLKISAPLLLEKKDRCRYFAIGAIHLEGKRELSHKMNNNKQEGEIPPETTSVDDDVK